MGQAVDGHKQDGAEGAYQNQADEHRCAADIQDGKEQQQPDQANREVGDVLRFQPLKFYGFIDRLVDGIDTVCHVLFF